MTSVPVSKALPSAVAEMLEVSGGLRGPIPLATLGRRLGADPVSLHAAVQQLRDDGRVTLVRHEGGPTSSGEARWHMAPADGVGEVGYVVLRRSREEVKKDVPGLFHPVGTRVRLLTTPYAGRIGRVVGHEYEFDDDSPWVSHRVSWEGHEDARPLAIWEHHELEPVSHEKRVMSSLVEKAQPPAGDAEKARQFAGEMTGHAFAATDTALQHAPLDKKQAPDQEEHLGRLAEARINSETAVRQADRGAKDESPESLYRHHEALLMNHDAAARAHYFLTNDYAAGHRLHHPAVDAHFEAYRTHRNAEAAHRLAAKEAQKRIKQLPSGQEERVMTSPVRKDSSGRHPEGTRVSHRIRPEWIGTVVGHEYPGEGDPLGPAVWHEVQWDDHPGVTIHHLHEHLVPINQPG